MILNKKKNYAHDLDMAKADEMLQNVFAAAGESPNTIMLDKLMLRKKVQTRGIMISGTISIIAMLLVLFSPLVFLISYSRITVPSIEENYMLGDTLYVIISPDSVGTDYRSSYAKDEQGNIIAPTVVDEGERTLAFPAEGSSLNIYIKNYSGKITHAIYTSLK